MRPSEALALHRIRIREIALNHHVSSVRVFGSALHGDDVAGSDLDLLVEPTPQTTMMDIGAIRFELKNLLGLEVDVLTPQWPTTQVSGAGFARGTAPMSRANLNSLGLRLRNAQCTFTRLFHGGPRHRLANHSKRSANA